MQKFKDFYNDEEKIYEEMANDFIKFDISKMLEHKKNIDYKKINDSIFSTKNKNENKKILLNILKREKWKNNSQDTNNPPDFYSDDFKMMIECMRINDYEIIEDKGKKQKKINPYAQKQASIFNEYKEFFSNLPKESNLVILADENNFSYEKYVNNFKRVIEHHDKQFSKYRKNHPNYKLIYLIFDDSGQIYYENYSKDNVLIIKDKKTDEILWTNYDDKIHYHYKDINFLKIIKECKADYVVWVAPYKINSSFRHWIRKVTFYNTKEIDLSCGKKFENLK